MVMVGCGSFRCLPPSPSLEATSLGWIRICDDNYDHYDRQHYRRQGLGVCASGQLCIVYLVRRKAKKKKNVGGGEPKGGEVEWELPNRHFITKQQRK